jgi:hypothetical protein
LPHVAQSTARHSANNERRRRAKQKKRNERAQRHTAHEAEDPAAPLGEVKACGTNGDDASLDPADPKEKKEKKEKKEGDAPRVQKPKGKGKRSNKKRAQRAANQKENAQWITLAPPMWQQPGHTEYFDREQASSSISHQSGASFYSHPMAHTAPPAFYPGDFGTVYYEAPQMHLSQVMYHSHGPPPPYALNVSSATPSLATTEESSLAFSGAPVCDVRYGAMPGHPSPFPPYSPHHQQQWRASHQGEGSLGARTHPFAGPPPPMHRNTGPPSPSRGLTEVVRRGKKKSHLTIQEAKICSDVLAQTTEQLYFQSSLPQRNNGHNFPASVYVEPPSSGMVPNIQTSSLSILEIMSCAWERHRPFADGEAFTTFAVLTQRLISLEEQIGYDACITRQVRDVLLQVMLSPTVYQELCQGGKFLSAALEMSSTDTNKSSVPKERTLVLYMALHFSLAPADLMAEIMWQNADCMLKRVNGILPLELLCHQMKLEISVIQGAMAHETQDAIIEPLESQAAIVGMLGKSPNFGRLWSILHTMLKCQFDVTRMRSGRPYHIFCIAHACAEMYLGESETSLFATKLIALMYPTDLYSSNEEGELPVHIAIENGKSFEEVSILSNGCSADIMAARDGKKGMNALTLAAASQNCETDVLYDLIRALPNHVRDLLVG